MSFVQKSLVDFPTTPLAARLVALSVALAVCCASSTVNAHMAFKKQMQKSYVGMKVSCNACHVKGKPKTERTEFGKVFAKKLKKSNPTLTSDYKTKKGDDKKEYEAEILIPAFKKTLKVVKLEKDKTGVTYDELIKSEKIDNIKKDPKYKPGETTNKEGGNQEGGN